MHSRYVFISFLALACRILGDDNLSLSHAKAQELPGARVLYPHELGACSQNGAQ